MPNTQLQQKVIRTLATAQVLNGLGVAGTVAAGSLLVSSVSNSETQAGLAQTSSVLGAAALALPLARLNQIGGRRLALSMGLILGVIGSLLVISGGLNENLYLILLGTFLVGAASASGYQARFAAIDLATSQRSSQQLSFVVWGSTIGAVAGPNLMQPSGDFARKLGFPELVGPYFISAITLTLATAVILIFLRPDPYLTANKLSSEKQKQITNKLALKHILGNKLARFAIAAITVGHVAMVSVMVMTPIHMAHVDVTLRIIGIVISIHVLGMYAFSPVVGLVSDRIGGVATIKIGLATLLISSVIAGTSPAGDAIRLGVGLFLLGLGWSCTLIAGSTLLSQSVELNFKSASQGASDLVMNLAGAGGGAVAGVIIATLSYGWLCLIASIPVAYLALTSLKLKPGLLK
jgi:MFS family permease